MKTKREEMLLIITIALGTLLNPLNSSMIAVALSRLQEEFHLTFADASWLISTYYLASAVGQPVMGKLSDAYGRKRIFFFGLSLVAIASMLAPFSPGFWWLIGFRVIQSLGSSALFPAGMGIIRNVITTRQARALGILSIFSSTSAAFGPSIGGFLIHFGDWPAIFLVNFPFILLSFLLALKILPNEPSTVTKPTPHMDLLGIGLFMAMIISWILFFLSLERTIDGWKLLLSLILTVLFYRYESRIQDPFVNVQSLRQNLNAGLIYVQFILVNIIFYSIFFGIPSYLEKVHHLDAKTIGIVMLSIAGFGIIIAPLTGRWVDRSGSKPALLMGSISLLLGSMLLLTLQPTSSVPWIFFVLSVLGFSNGFNNLGLQNALYFFVPPEETGTASGLFMTSRYIGTILSSSLLGILFGKNITAGGLHMIALVSSVLGGVILLLTLRMPPTRGRPAASEDH